MSIIRLVSNMVSDLVFMVRFEARDRSVYGDRDQSRDRRDEMEV